MVTSAEILRKIIRRCVRGLRSAFAYLLMVGGIAWLGCLGWIGVELLFDLVPSADVGMTYFLPFAFSTGFLAVLAIAGGGLLALKRNDAD